MTRRILSSALALAMVAAFVPSVIAGQLESAEPEFNFYGMQRTRYDSFNNYFDFLDTEDTASNDRNAFWGTRTLVGMKTTLARGVWSKIELQHIGSFGNQDPLRSATGDGDFPYFQNFDPMFHPYGFRENEVELYRAIIGMNEIGGSGLGIAVGRQNYTVGGGLIFGDESFYSGTVFDGVTGWYDWDSVKLRGAYFITSERNDPATLFGAVEDGVSDETVYGFDVMLPLNDGENNNWGDVSAYVYQYNDQASFANGLEEMILGAQWGRDAYMVDQVKANPMTWSLEVAFQDGEDDDDDASGYVAEGWFGWNFLSHDRIIHRPAAGFFMTPGDDDQTDDDFTGFSPWWGYNHCRLGCADYFDTGFGAFDTGIMATWVGYTIMTNPGRHKGWVKYWDFKPTEDSIDTGGGKVDVDDFGTEIDLGYSYGYSENLRLFVSYAQMSPDDGLTGGGNNPDDAVTRFYGGFNLKFK